MLAVLPLLESLEVLEEVAAWVVIRLDLALLDKVMLEALVDQQTVVAGELQAPVVDPTLLAQLETAALVATEEMAQHLQ
jgi:hypothetical protein